MVLMARREEIPAKPTLSVVVPAYNEAATFDVAFSRLLNKQLDGVDIEIVVVESNSTDGTRELVARHENHPRVTVVWQDRPRGKGHAVRAGLERVTGDYVLIQDADLEYDLEDYETPRSNRSCTAGRRSCSGRVTGAARGRCASSPASRCSAR